MNEQLFFTKSEEVLNNLMDMVEAMDFEDIPDVELNSGILTIDFDDHDLHYVVNRHNASGQVWLSSPISGASYFELDAQNNWLPVKGSAKIELEKLMKQELNSIE